jgi:hypothetical protein
MPSPPSADAPPRVGRVPLVVAALLVAATVALFLAFTHDRAGVWLSAPLDDTFIHFQYAKQLARGRVLQFNDGDSPTTGATSLLYLLLLAPGWIVGFRGLHLLVWAWLVNAGLHLIGGLTVFATVNRLTRRRTLSYTALGAFLLSGPSLWGAYSHMEVALFSTLALLALHDAIQLAGEGGRAALRRLLVWGALLAAVRPEGMLMAGGISLWLLWRHMGRERPEGLHWRGWLWQGRLLAVPLGTAVALLLLYLALTGRFATNAAVKSHLRHLLWDPGTYFTTTLNWLPMTLRILLEKWPSLVQPLTTLLVLGGLACWAVQGSWRRPGAGALVLGWLVLLTLFYALFVARRDHFDRYYLPYFGLTLVAMWWALGRIAERLGSLAGATTVVAALVLVVMLPQTRHWAAKYGDNCRDLAHQHFIVARWVKEHTPSDSRIAVNDAGAIPYLSERYAYDIVGLVHNAFYGRKTHMPYYQTAPVWEALEALPHRPRYMVAYPEWIRDIHRLRPFSELKRFPLKKRTIVANETKIVWELRWDWLEDPNRPPPPATGPPLAQIDRLDVADLDSEADHAYRRLDTDQPEGLVHQQPVADGKRVLIDGGRKVREGEAFTLSARSGKPAIVLLRTLGPGRLDLEVHVNGEPAGRWQSQLRPGFNEQPFFVRGNLVSGSSLEIELRARIPYTSFHYWLMQ